MRNHGNYGNPYSRIYHMALLTNEGML